MEIVLTICRPQSCKPRTKSITFFVWKGRKKKKNGKKFFEDGKEVANFEADFLPSDLPKEEEKEDEEQSRAEKSAMEFWRLKHNYAETPKRRFTCIMRCRDYCYFECIIIYIFFPYTANEYGWIRLQIITMADLSSCKTKNPARQNGILTWIVKQLMQAT